MGITHNPLRMEKGTPILLGVFIVSFLVNIFGGGFVASTEPGIGAAATEVQNHLFFITVPFVLINLVMLLTGALLIIRGIRHLFRKKQSSSS